MKKKSKVSNPRESSNPILLSSISDSYSKAFALIWKNELENQHPSARDFPLLLHPVSHLLGVAIETAIKGLLICRGKQAGKIHNLEKLLTELGDSSIEQALDDSLCDLPIPSELIDANRTARRSELEAMYRRHHVHFWLLNGLYDFPYATRYPVLDGHSLPDPLALGRIAQVLQRRLHSEMRRWPPQVTQ